MISFENVLCVYVCMASVQVLVCVMCGAESVLCAGFSMCAMCGIERVLFASSGLCFVQFAARNPMDWALM